VASGDGVTLVPEADAASPTAETPGTGPVGPTLIAVVGAGAVAEVAGESALVAAVAGGVPVGVGMPEGEVAGVVPVGVRMSDVAVVGAVTTLVVPVLVALVLVAPAPVPPAAGVVVGMKKLLEPRPPPV
jgi:hypothetical protein